MNELQVFFSIGLLILLILISFLYMIKSADNKTEFFIIFIIGAAGWTVALFARLVPLQLLQSISLILLGADLTSSVSIAQYASNPIVLIWGPLLAALFEESARLICMFISRNIREDRNRTPFMLGLGWTSAEIVLLYIFNIIALLFQPEVAWALMLTGLVERIIASALHITLSYIIFYALFETPFLKKFSLWLAMVFHFVVNAFIVVWIVLFQNIDYLLWAWSLEAVFAITVFAMALFTWKYWIPRVSAQNYMVCPQCSEVNRQVKFCIYCGAALSSDAETTSKPIESSEK
ncbi:MAG: YhfC family glutamic-type intramembrane protease [Promethearchaeota archaeon]